MNLFEDLGIEVTERIVLYAVTDLDWVAADFAVFDVGLTANRQVENHRNLFPTIWASKEVFHWESILQQVHGRHPGQGCALLASAISASRGILYSLNGEYLGSYARAVAGSRLARSSKIKTITAFFI